jgi:hypothetical protein
LVISLDFVRFRKYSFVLEVVRDQPIFKLPEEKITRVFVSDLFRDRVLAAGLKGFEFTEIWDSQMERSDTWGGCMKIYVLESSGEENIILENRNEDCDFIDTQFQGNPISRWGDIRVRSIQGKPRDCVDFLSGIPIFSRNAVECLEDFLDDAAEVLPLIHEGYDLNAINCIDDQLSVSRTLRTGHFIGYEKYAFIPEELENVHFFKIPKEVKTKVFVSDQFRDAVIQNDLTGFRFIEVWNSNDSGITEQEENEQIAVMLQKSKVSERVYGYIDTMYMVNDGKAIASGKWKLQKKRKGIIMLGEYISGAYEWMDPLFYPPILREYDWFEVERTDI